jgi:hypothetical protein
MPPVSVRKWVDRYEAMVEAYGEFIGPIDSMLAPMACIRHELPDLWPDVELHHTDVLLGRAHLARPSPDGTEHLSMQLVEGSLREHVCTPPSAKGTSLCPFESSLDVRLFQLVQLVTCRNVALK